MLIEFVFIFCFPIFLFVFDFLILFFCRLMRLLSKSKRVAMARFQFITTIHSIQYSLNAITNETMLATVTMKQKLFSCFTQSTIFEIKTIYRLLVLIYANIILKHIQYIFECIMRSTSKRT